MGGCADGGSTVGGWSRTVGEEGAVYEIPKFKFSFRPIGGFKN